MGGSSIATTARTVRARAGFCGVAVLCALAGCGSADDVPGPVVPAASMVFQGTITGLGSLRPVVLQYNGQDTCTDADTPADEGAPCRFFGTVGQEISTFSFGSLPAGTPYSITVKSQPYGKICTVANANGTLGGTPVIPAVTCVNDPAVPRHAVTVSVAPAVAASPGATVRSRSHRPSSRGAG